ncbi:MAG: DUF362 domain-containing protein [Acidobacteria bacterium]|nr:DUF362 domain-containing protein [Acidobacteriota bacterium]
MRRSRREFLTDSLKTVAAGPLLIGASTQWFHNAFGEIVPTDRWRGRVVVARAAKGSTTPATPGALLDRAMARLMEEETATAAWKRLFRPDDVVAIKVNAMAGRPLVPRYELVRAIAMRLNGAGIPDERIIVWDRSDRELQRAGYTLNTTGRGLKIFGTDALVDGYEPQLSHAMTVGSCFARILTRHCTAAINLGVLKDHDLAGVAVMLKNFYGVIHNPNKYHNDNCSPSVAHLWTHDSIRRKVRLHIADAHLAQYHGGPAFHSAYTWPFHGLIVATDGVAADRVAQEIIERRRREAGMSTLAAEHREPAYLAEAGRLGLGEACLDAIRWLEI